MTPEKEDMMVKATAARAVNSRPAFTPASNNFIKNEMSKNMEQSNISSIRAINMFYKSEEELDFVIDPLEIGAENEEEKVASKADDLFEVRSLFTSRHDIHALQTEKSLAPNIPDKSRVEDIDGESNKEEVKNEDKNITKLMEEVKIKEPIEEIEDSSPVKVSSKYIFSQNIQSPPSNKSKFEKASSISKILSENEFSDISKENVSSKKPTESLLSKEASIEEDSKKEKSKSPEGSSIDGFGSIPDVKVCVSNSFLFSFNLSEIVLNLLIR